MVTNLRSLRLSKGVSQQQLADVIGTTQQSINKYENHSTDCVISKTAGRLPAVFVWKRSLVLYSSSVLKVV